MDADALPDILHDLAGCAHASFRNALEAIVKACPGSSLLGGCASERAVKSVSRMRAKVHEYRAEEGATWPACASVRIRSARPYCAKMRRSCSRPWSRSRRGRSDCCG